MDLIEIGKLTVAPFELERILELKLEKKINEHATLYFYGVIKDGLEDKIIDEISESTPIKFQNGNKVVFNGILQDINVTCENAVYYVEVKAISNTILLDLTPMKRSFQEKEQEFKSIVSHVIKDKKAKAEFNAPVKKVENIILQYNETDWEFAKRLASHSNSVLIPVSNSDKPEFLFGVAEGVEYKEKLEVFNYSVSKRMSDYRLLSQSQELNYTEEDAIVYTLKTDDFVFEVGDALSLNKSALYIYSANIHLKESVLTCTYLLSGKTAISAPKKYNKDISGLTLTGTVIKAENDKVKVHLAIDEKQEEGKAYPFSYATNYSAEGHTGWYVMPEEGDTVQVIFPTEDENEAYATMSVRQEDSEKTTDPSVKYLRTPNGKEIKLDKEEILITSKDDVTYIKINESSGIEIKTDKPISVTSGATISMTSAGDFTIDSGKNLNISAADSIVMNCRENTVKIETEDSGIEMEAKKPIKVTGGDTVDITSEKAFTATAKEDFKISSEKKLDTSASETIEITCKDNAIKLETGSSGVEIEAKKPIKMTGEDTIDITGEKDITVSSSKDLNLSSDKKLAISAESEIENSCNGSSIKLDGEIDLKAKLIKEN